MRIPARMPSTRALIAVAVAMLFAFPALVLLDIPSNAKAYSDVNIDLEYPRYAGADQKVQCTLTITGGPASDIGGNFSYKADLIGKDITGSPIVPKNVTSQNNVFRFNVTMPLTAPQTVKLKINASSQEWIHEETRYKERSFEIKVVMPILITATAYNTGQVDAKDVTANFYADDTFLGSQIFNVSAGASKTLYYNWTFVSIDEGKHVVKVVLDGANGVVEFSEGNNVYALTIYVGNQSNPLGAVLTASVVIMSVLVALTILAKPQKKKKKS